MVDRAVDERQHPFLLVEGPVQLRNQEVIPHEFLIVTERISRFSALALLECIGAVIVDFTEQRALSRSQPVIAQTPLRYGRGLLTSDHRRDH